MQPTHRIVKPRHSSVLVGFLAFGCLAILPLSAQTRTWNGSANAFWSNAGNWNEDAFINGANVVMPAGAGNRNNAIGAGRAVQSLTITSDALSYRIGTSNNNSGTADSVTLTFRSAGVLTIEAGNTANHSIGLNLNNAAVGSISLAGTFSVNHHGSGLLSLTRPVTNTGSLTKNGTGELRLTAANTFSGNVTINAGTLVGAGATNSPGISVFGARDNNRTITVNDGGTLEFRSGNVLGVNHVATTAPTLVINQGGTVTNAAPASNNALRDVQLNGGTLTSTTGHQSSSEPFLPVYAAWNLNGTVTSTGESTISTSDPNRGTVMLKVTDDKTTEFNVVSGTLTVAAPIIDNPTDSNIGSLKKTGAGAMILTAPNAYTGTTIVDEGTLVIGSIHASGAPISVSIAATDAILQLDFEGKQLATALEIGGVPQGPGIYGAVGSPVPVVGIAQITGTGTLEVSGTTATGYAAWAEANAGGQGPDLDFDGDGVTNGIEFFLNAAPGFTSLVTLDVNHTVTWTNGGNIPATGYGTQFVVQTSGDLIGWTDVPVADLVENTGDFGVPGNLTFTLTGTEPRFVRLKVTPQ